MGPLLHTKRWTKLSQCVQIIMSSSPMVFLRMLLAYSLKSMGRAETMNATAVRNNYYALG